MLKDPNGKENYTQTLLKETVLLLAAAACLHTCEPMGYVSNHSAEEYLKNLDNYRGLMFGFCCLLTWIK